MITDFRTKKIFVFITFFFYGAGIFSSCAGFDKTSAESSNSERVLASGIPIQTFSSEETISDNTVETSEPFEVNVPQYDLAECEFKIDSVTKHISAHYDDTEQKGNEGYIVDYDLQYVDYGVDTVSVYSAERSSDVAVHYMPIEDTLWMEIIDSMPKACRWCSMEKEKRTMINDALLSYRIDNINDVTELRDLSELLDENYDIFPYVTSYKYPLDRIIEENHDPDTSYLYTESKNYDSVIEGDITRYTLRTELDGLPIGVPEENRLVSTKEKYGDYYGSIWGVDDDYLRNFYSDDSGCVVDVIFYNYNVTGTLQDNLKVMPLEDCICNSLYGALHEALSSNSHYCCVYGAELIYLPFSENCTEIGDWNYNVIFVPMWAIYTVVDGDYLNSSTIYLNAVTGELVSYGL